MLPRQRKNCNSSYFNIVPNIYYVQLLTSKWAKIHEWCAEFILSWENIPARPNPCSSFFYRYASRGSWENIKSIHLVYKEIESTIPPNTKYPPHAQIFAPLLLKYYSQNLIIYSQCITPRLAFISFLHPSGISQREISITVAKINHPLRALTRPIVHRVFQSHARDVPNGRYKENNEILLV